MPEELGEAPEYKPRSNDGRKRSSFKGGGRRNNGTGKGGNRNNNKRRDGSKKPTQAKKQVKFKKRNLFRFFYVHPIIESDGNICQTIYGAFRHA